MHAVVISAPGGPDVLQWRAVPDPVIGAQEVLVRVAAAGVNRADLLQRQGSYQPPAGSSPYPGLECSGIVEAVGEQVTGWSRGDAAVALLTGGGYAELVAVPAGQLMPVPPGVDLIEAAALPEAACTVWSNVFQAAALQPGQTLLIHGGSSGIGTLAIQLARALGATVAVTAGSAQKLARCAQLGAQILVDYREQDFVAEVRAATAGHGADVVLDNMGAAYLGRNVDVLATGGRLAIIGMQGGTRGELDIGQLMGRRASVIATTLRARPVSEKAAICAEVVAHVWPLVARGAVRPVVDRAVPMAQAEAAHRVLQDSSHVGKVLLLPGSTGPTPGGSEGSAAPV